MTYWKYEIGLWIENALKNLDPAKQSKEVIFSKKIIPGTHPSLCSNNSLLEQATT